MTIRSESRMERLLHQGVFCVTSEVVPPRGADPSVVSAQARGLVGYADAVNVTDNPTDPSEAAWKEAGPVSFQWPPAGEAGGFAGFVKFRNARIREL